LKNRILLENYDLPGDLEDAVHRFVEHYNHARYHESLGNLTPADVYFGRGRKILNMREKIKPETIQKRRLTPTANPQLNSQPKLTRSFKPTDGVEYSRCAQ
jgi:putative transposase